MGAGCLKRVFVLLKQGGDEATTAALSIMGKMVETIVRINTI